MSAVSELSGLKRLHAKEVMNLLDVKKSVFYAGIASGRYPKPDGTDGVRPFWRVDTLHVFLAAPAKGHAIDCTAVSDCAGAEDQP